ncbi:MAG TPA: GAF domain-containing protein [Chryseosolibacter sp.]|nr:GAF domain-containing protein [Chryseosolibacter sp.]
METMLTLEKPANEVERLNALKKYEILDTPADGSFDRITALASTIFKVPIAIISLVDTDRIWFKSHHGLNVKEINRDPGLCASAIMSKDVYVIENAKEDPRCLTNPLVAGEFGLRFYAATPLTTEDNYNLGTLCIIDQQPRKLTPQERAVLKSLGEIVMDEMNMRIAVRDTASNVKNLASDMSEHLRVAAANIKESSKEEITTHLELSRMYLKNVQNQLQNL